MSIIDVHLGIRKPRPKMKIRKYTLNFIRLGKPVNDKYPIYIRYFYTLQGKKYCYNINCHTSLLEIEFIQLQDVKNVGKTTIDQNKQNFLRYVINGTPTIKPLFEKIREVKGIIEDLNEKNGEYPSIETLKDHILKPKDLRIETLINEYLQTTKGNIKEISLKRYKERLSHLKTHLQTNPKYFYEIEDLVTKKMIENLQDYLNHTVKKTISNSTYRNIITSTLTFLNYLGEKYNLPTIKVKVKIPLLSEKIHITEKEFNLMVNYDVTQSGLRTNNLKNLQLTQDIIYINSLIGLRINELLQVKKQNITLNHDHIVIKFLEHKKNDIREVVIIDHKGIDILKSYHEKTRKDNLFHITTPTLNNNLKILGKLIGMTQPFEYVKNYRQTTITLTKPKWELLSSHSIRRYAVNENVEKYGIDVTRQFSGHKDFTTIIKHYLKNKNSQDLLKQLTSK